MPISPGGIFLLVLFGAYLGIRLENLDAIWAEIEDYEGKLEKDYLTFISSTYFEPYGEAITSRMSDAFGGLESYQDDEENETQGEVEYDSVDDLAVEVADESPEDWSAIMDEFPPPEEVIPNIFRGLFEVTGIDQIDEIERYESPQVAFLVNEGILNPEEIFSETRTFYRKYRWPTRIYGVTQLLILSLVIVIIGVLIFSALNNPIVDRLPNLIVLLGVLWLIAEFSLWYILSTEVDMETRTLVGKFLQPDPRDFL